MGMLDNVISFLPPDRQILLFSATFPQTVEEFTVSDRVLVISGSLTTSLSRSESTSEIRKRLT